MIVRGAARYSWGAGQLHTDWALMVCKPLEQYSAPGVAKAATACGWDAAQVQQGLIRWWRLSTWLHQVS